MATKPIRIKASAMMHPSILAKIRQGEINYVIYPTRGTGYKIVPNTAPEPSANGELMWVHLIEDQRTGSTRWHHFGIDREVVLLWV